MQKQLLFCVYFFAGCGIMNRYVKIKNIKEGVEDEKSNVCDKFDGNMAVKCGGIDY